MHLYYFRHINTFGLSILTRLWERFRKIEDLLRNLCNDVPKVAGSSGLKEGTGDPHRRADGLLSSVRCLLVPAGYAGESVFGGGIRPGEVRG